MGDVIFGCAVIFGIHCWTVYAIVTRLTTGRPVLPWKDGRTSSEKAQDEAAGANQTGDGR